MKKLLFAGLLLLPFLSFSQQITDTGTLRSRINLQIVPNGNQAITGSMLNYILNGYLNTWPDSRINAVYPLTWNPASRTLQFVGSMTGVPTTRKLKINGVEFDLSGDRVWNVGTVTAVQPGWGMVISGTQTATVTADTTAGKLATQWYAESQGFTNAKVWAALSATSPIVFNNTTGNFSLSTLPPAYGGLGLTSVGTSGQMLKSTGSGWMLWTPNFLTGTDTISLSNRILSVNGLVFGAGLLKTGNTVVALVNSAIWNASQLQGYNVSTNVPTIDGQVLTWNATFHYWEARTFETGITEAEADLLYFKIASNLSEGDAPTMRTNLGGTTLGQNIFTVSNVAAISFMRVNADNTVSMLSAGAYRTAIGSTTIGDNLFTLTNPSAITFPRFNADNTVSALNASSFRAAIGSTTIGDAVFTAANPSAIAFLRANADNTVTWRSAANFLTDLGGTTVGQNLFTVANPSAIRFIKINADNTITLNTASAELSDMGGQPLLSGTGFVKSVAGVISYDNSSYQPLDPDLTTIAGLTATTNNFLVSQSSSWASVTPATVKGILAYILASSDFANQGTTTTVLHGNAAGNPTWAQIVNADISATAAIVYSKLNLSGSIVNADVATGAAIAYSKLSLTGSILNADVSTSAAIAYSKLSLTGNIVNADISASAGIVYSKLNLSNSIVAGDITNGTITGAKLASTLDLSGSATTFKDGANLILENATTTSKQVQFSLASITSATTRTFTFPDISSTFAVTGNNLSVFSSTTSAQLAGVISDETGTGALVFGTSPTFTTPNLGTPSALTLTNATGLPLTGLTGLATGIATFLGTPSSANLAAAITDETGTGALVFGTSPNFTTGITIGSVAVPTISSTNTFTNKRWTQRVGSTTSSATPTINTDNFDLYKLTAQTADITSFTTNLSGTPNDGDRLEIQITGTAARNITWGTSFVSGAATLPTATNSTTTLTVLFEYYTTSSYGNNKWVCVSTY